MDKSVIWSSGFASVRLRASASAMKIALDASGVTPLKGRVLKVQIARSMPTVMANATVTCARAPTPVAPTKSAAMVRLVAKGAAVIQPFNVRIVNNAGPDNGVSLVSVRTQANARAKAIVRDV